MVNRNDGATKVEVHCGPIKENPMKNSEGYTDLTPHDAIANMDAEEKERREAGRVTKLLHTLFYICNVAGYTVEERIVLKDRRTGRIWR